MRSRDALLDRTRAAFASTRETESRAIIPELVARGGIGQRIVQALWAENPPPSVKRWVVEAAAACTGRWVGPLIREALNDPAMTVRLHALIAIGIRGDKSLARSALPLAHDPSGGIRTNCLDLLADLRVPGWRSAAEVGLTDSKAYVRIQCRRLLDAAIMRQSPSR